MIGGGDAQSEELAVEEPVISPEFNEEVRATPLGLALNSGSAGKGILKISSNSDIPE